MIVPPGESNLEQQENARPAVLRDDTRLAAGKIAVFQYAAVAVFLFLISGFWQLQVQRTELYSERAQQNSIKSFPVLAPRGRLLDRDGRVIVDNHSSFTLTLSRENLKLEHLRAIAEGLDLDYADLAARVNRFRSRPKYELIVIKEELTPAELAFVESHKDFFPEMELIPAQRRLYPQNGMAAHVIGYTGEISESELDMPEFARYDQGDVIGKFGIERQYNSVLMGVDGQRRAVVDNRGRVRHVIGLTEAVPGKDLQLTLDLDLQAVAELAMEGRKGAVVALDPRNGEVLAMVSRPTFDPNKFTARIKASDWKEIANNPDHPLLNRAIQAQQAPGSTFKPIVAMAGLETSTIDEAFSVHCSGGASFYGHYYRCHKRHGGLSLHRAIAESCDVYFYTIGNKLQIDNIATYAEMCGLGRKSGIDLPHEADGVVPSTRWKLRNLRQKWYAGETISVAIGQGALTVTPLQLARAIGGLAIGGVWHRPHLVLQDTKKEQPRQWPLHPENVRKVVDGMYGVVNEGGTGGRARLPGIEVCGKTGTAQLASNEFLKGSAAGRKLKDNAWFVGFAPRQAPEIVVVALWEGGEHGHFAAPIVRDVIKVYFDKKARLAAELKAQQAAAAARANALLPLPGAAPVTSSPPAALPSSPGAAPSPAAVRPPGGTTTPPAPGATVPGSVTRPPAAGPQVPASPANPVPQASLADPGLRREQRARGPNPQPPASHSRAGAAS